MESVKPIEDDLVVLPDPRLDPTRTNILRARKITISGRVGLAAQSIALYAEEIEFLDGGLIDTSGGEPDSDFTSDNPALGGSAPGEAGKSGNNGSNGKSAGAIRIWARTITGQIKLRAVGGRGGRGQDGGNGQTGAAGNDSKLHTVRPRLCPGDAGHIGGSAGPPGSSGNGGDGGYIEIAIINADAFNLTLEQAQTISPPMGGQGGAAAKAGKPGDGGNGGKGGPFGHFQMTDYARGPRVSYFVQDGQSPQGPQGPKGDSVPDGKPGVKGADGTINLRPLSLTEFSSATTSNYLALLLAVGEGLYLNSQFTDAAKVLGFARSVSLIRLNG